MKVVINICYGGFALSQKAIDRLAELGSNYVVGYVDTDGNAVNDFSYIHFYSHEFRTDEKVIQAVMELGEESWNEFSELKIIDIPDDINWEFEDDNGKEEIREVSRRWS